jgi:Uncharacterized protein conserved in bacteria
MASLFIKKISRWNVAWHRDLGYFFSSLTILYCISGMALNHINDWNPDFIIRRDTLQLTQTYTKQQITEGAINGFGKLVNEKKYKVYDFPTDDQVKIYYDNASFHIHFKQGFGVYENVARRHLFYETNVLHRNSLKQWKWVSDIFALMLVVITVTGLFILKGKYGLKRRGVWIMLAGFILPLAGIVWFYITSG